MLHALCASGGKMYKNYLKIAYRNIAKNKLFSTINFIGLSVGLASFAILMKFVLFESSYDSFHKKSDHIYRLVTGKFAKVPDLWSAGIKNDFPEVLSFVRMQFAGRQFVANGEKRFYESYGMFADSNFFDIFSFRLLQGNSHNVLTAEKSIVVTRSFAYKYFGNENPVDKTLTFFNDEGNGVDYKITGVCEDVPPNSHFTFDYLISNSSNKAPWVNNWTWDQFYSYLLLKDNVNKTELTSKITKWLSTKLDKEQMPGSIDLQKITDIHLHSNLEREMSVNRDISTLYIFGGIGILILLIAVINFVNLTTAKSVTRAKEVGIRKTIGAGTGTLFKQFLGESLLTTLSVFLISILILNLILPSFNELFSSNLHFSLSKDLFFIAALLAITLLAGIAGSVYPAMVLSSLKPTRILKGEIVWRGGSTLRKSLVVVQFAISSFLIISSLVIYSQMKFIQNKKLGFNKDHIIYFQITNDNIRNNTEAIKSELLSYTGVKSVTVSANLPGGGDYGIPYKAEGIDDSKRPVMRILVVDEDFFKTYGIELLAGRNFSKDIPTDRSAYILNETAAKTLGWKNPLSKKLSMPVVKRDWAPVIGVVTDFHYRSLHEKIEPLMIIEEHKDWYSYFSLKINTEN